MPRRNSNLTSNLRRALVNYASPQTVADARAVGTITPGYMTGFGNSFETEALPGALPIGRNSPQKCSYGLTLFHRSRAGFGFPDPEPAFRRILDREFAAKAGRRRNRRLCSRSRRTGTSRSARAGR